VHTVDLGDMAETGHSDPMLMLELFVLLTEERSTGENPSYIVSGSAVTSAPYPCNADVDA
jgi:hypothetical protein